MICCLLGGFAGLMFPLPMGSGFADVEYQAAVNGALGIMGGWCLSAFVSPPRDIARRHSSSS
jgi:hypothetical protein